jgi:hypothetical protein
VAGEMELEYAEHKLRDSPCLLGKISLKKIVESFSAGINEEQAWACLYQSLLFCKKSIIALSTSGSIVLNESLICPDIDNLYLDKDGFVAVVKSGSEVEELGELINRSIKWLSTLNCGLIDLEVAYCLIGRLTSAPLREWLIARGCHF